MIQPIKPIPTAWNLHWVEIGDPPLPEGEDFFLPTLVLATDDKGALLDEPQVLVELDQTRIEEMLGRLFERGGTPRRLIIAHSEDWDENAWRRFSADYKLEIRFADIPPRSPDDLNRLAHKVAECHPGARKAKETPSAKVAAGLINVALRVRSPSKRAILLRKALELEPESAMARIELADMAFHAGRFATSLEAYEQILSTEQKRFEGSERLWDDPKTRPFLRAHLGRAMTLWQQGHYGEAAEICDYLLRINPRDNQGARFYLPMLLLLNEDHLAAAAYFRRYAESYPGDYAEPAFLFGWALTLSMGDDEAVAKAKYREAMARNIYIAAMLLEAPEPTGAVWHPNDRAEPSYAGEFIDSYAVLWDRDTSAIRLLREAHAEFQPYLEKIIELRRLMADYQDQRYEPDYRSKWKKLVAQDDRLISGAAAWQPGGEI